MVLIVGLTAWLAGIFTVFYWAGRVAIGDISAKQMLMNLARTGLEVIDDDHDLL